MKRSKQGRKSGVRNVREILRLLAAGLNQTQIAQSCNVSRAMVQDYQRRAKAVGLEYEAVRELSDEELFFRLGKRGGRKERKPCELAFDEIAREYQKKGVTLQLLWREYVIGQGKDLSYQEFCRRFRSWSMSTNYVMRQGYVPGEKLLVDYAGLKIAYFDAETLERRMAEIFVGTLGASSYTYCEATADQKLYSWLGSHSRAFEFFGGVPSVIVPDNLKSGVKDAWWYEPEINRSYQDFAEYHGIAILPTRVRMPRDKGKVEKAVQEVERWVLAPLRNRTFYSIAEINQALRELLAALNAKRMREYGASRQELFERIDRAALKPLPAQRYEFAEWKRARVNIDYHLEFGKHYYSVPYQYVRQEVWVKATERCIEIFQNNRRIALHARSRREFCFTTLTEHMPPEHAEVKSWNVEKFSAWGKSVGASTAAFVQLLLTKKAHVEQGFRAVLGLQRMCQKYTPERIEATCKRALHFKLHDLRSIRSILEKGLDELELSKPAPERVLQNHTNLRGEQMFH